MARRTLFAVREVIESDHIWILVSGSIRLRKRGSAKIMRLRILDLKWVARSGVTQCPRYYLYLNKHDAALYIMFFT